MARLQTGAQDGMHVELVTERLERHVWLTDLPPARVDEIRDILNHALMDILRLAEPAPAGTAEGRARA